MANSKILCMIVGSEIACVGCYGPKEGANTAVPKTGCRVMELSAAGEVVVFVAALVHEQDPEGIDS